MIYFALRGVVLFPYASSLLVMTPTFIYMLTKSPLYIQFFEDRMVIKLVIGRKEYFLKEISNVCGPVILPLCFCNCNCKVDSYITESKEIVTFKNKDRIVWLTLEDNTRFITALQTNLQRVNGIDS